MLVEGYHVSLSIQPSSALWVSSGGGGRYLFSFKSAGEATLKNNTDYGGILDDNSGMIFCSSP